jgi:fatty acid desaturase/cytochrome b involved in lipid metabolism
MCIPGVPTKAASATAATTTVETAKGNADASLRSITVAELATKTSIHEVWIAYDGIVFDVTHWLAKHPGGIRSIMSVAGQDASSVMKSLHTQSTLQTYIRRMRKVGKLTLEEEEDSVAAADDDAPSSKQKEKAKQALKRADEIHKDIELLNEKLVKEGWYEAQPLAYWAAILRVVLMATAGVGIVLWTQQTNTVEAYSSYTRMAAVVFGSVLIGLFFQNAAFMGHDAGHGSITGNFMIDRWFGLVVGNGFTGIDVGWWKSTHYVHHSATNSLHDDPDIQHMPMFCFEERMADNRWSTYHGRYMPLDAIGRAILPYQHYLFYPLLAVARFNLYIQSIIYVIQTCPLSFSKSGKRMPSGEEVIDEVTGEVKEKYAWPKPSATFWLGCVTSLVFFWCMMVTFFSSLDPVSAVVCLLVSHSVAGILHVQILLSHVAMHYCVDGHGSVGAVTAPNGNDEAGFYEWQALSTMDVDCPPWMDWFHGGLQFQLEHHLFPRVPRWRLRALCPLTDAIFAKHNVPVVRIGFYEANVRVLKHMAKVGATVAKMKTV